MALVPLPFSTFGSIVDAGWRAAVFCPGCYVTVPIETADALRPRLAFHALFRCGRTRGNGRRCDSRGHLHILSPNPIVPTSSVPWCELCCGAEAAPWFIQHVRIGEPPWPKLTNQDRFRCPGCRGPVGWTWHGSAGIPHTDGYKPGA